jgi:hypothetical protein
LFQKSLDGDSDSMESVVADGNGWKGFWDFVLGHLDVVQVRDLHHLSQCFVVGREKGDHFEHVKVLFTEGQRGHNFFDLSSHLPINEFNFEIVFRQFPFFHLILNEIFFVVWHQIDRVLNIEICINDEHVGLLLNFIELTYYSKRCPKSCCISTLNIRVMRLISLEPVLGHHLPERQIGDPSLLGVRFQIDQIRFEVVPLSVHGLVPVVQKSLGENPSVQKALHEIVKVTDDFSHQSVLIGWMNDWIKTAIFIEVQTEKRHCFLREHPHSELPHQLLQFLVAEGDLCTGTANADKKLVLKMTLTVFDS